MLDLARLVSARLLAAQGSLPVAETRAFVSCPSYLLAMALVSPVCCSLPTGATGKMPGRAGLVRRAPIHSARAVVLRLVAGQVWGSDRRLLLLLPFGDTPRSVAQ